MWASAYGVCTHTVTYAHVMHTGATAASRGNQGPHARVWQGSSGELCQEGNSYMLKLVNHLRVVLHTTLQMRNTDQQGKTAAKAGICSKSNTGLRPWQLGCPQAPYLTLGRRLSILRKSVSSDWCDPTTCPVTCLSPVRTQILMLALARRSMHSGTPACSLSSIAVQPSRIRSFSIFSLTAASFSSRPLRAVLAEKYSCCQLHACSKQH